MCQWYSQLLGEPGSGRLQGRVVDLKMSACIDGELTWLFRHGYGLRDQMDGFGYDIDTN
jgi:hypothetical protein